MYRCRKRQRDGTPPQTDFQNSTAPQPRGCGKWPTFLRKSLNNMFLKIAKFRVVKILVVEQSSLRIGLGGVPSLHTLTVSHRRSPYGFPVNRYVRAPFSLRSPPKEPVCRSLLLRLGAWRAVASSLPSAV